MKKYASDLVDASDYHIIEQVVKAVKNKPLTSTTLEKICQQLSLTPCGLEQVFTNFANVPPIKFFQLLQKDELGRQIKDVAIFTANQSSEISKRVVINKIETIDYKNLTKKITVIYGVCSTIFGSCFIAAANNQSICHLAFTEDVDVALSELQKYWALSRFVRDDKQMASLVNNIFRRNVGVTEGIDVLVKGTEFQLKVWQNLLDIKPGKVVSYSDVAYSIGSPAAVRAVASAIASNNIAYIIPCHRVISKQGNTHEYRWGAERKKIMLGWEAAKFSQQL